MNPSGRTIQLQNGGKRNSWVKEIRLGNWFISKARKFKTVQNMSSSVDLQIRRENLNCCSKSYHHVSPLEFRGENSNSFRKIVTLSSVSYILGAKIQTFIVLNILSSFSPCFSGQLALYCRHDLNVRSTSHLLLAFAALHEPCRAFLRRYFAKTIVLPTDWTAVPDLIQTFIYQSGISDFNAGKWEIHIDHFMVPKGLN